MSSPDIAPVAEPVEFLIDVLPDLVRSNDTHLAIGGIIAARYLRDVHPEIETGFSMHIAVLKATITKPNMTIDKLAQYGNKSKPGIVSRIIGNKALEIGNRIADRPRLQNKALALIDAYEASLPSTS